MTSLARAQRLAPEAAARPRRLRPANRTPARAAVTAGPNACPGCTDTGPHSTHDAACLIGKAPDATDDDDRAWFAAHPLQVAEVRLVERAERMQLKGCAVEPQAYVIVTRLGQGARHRCHCGVIIPARVPA